MPTRFRQRSFERKAETQNAKCKRRIGSRKARERERERLPAFPLASLFDINNYSVGCRISGIQ